MGWVNDAAKAAAQAAKAVKDDAGLKDRVRQQLKDGKSASDYFAKQSEKDRGERKRK